MGTPLIDFKPADGYLFTVPNPLVGTHNKIGPYSIVCRATFQGGENADGNIQFLIATPAPNFDFVDLNYTIDRDDWNAEFDGGTDAFVAPDFSAGDEHEFALVVDDREARMYLDGVMMVRWHIGGGRNFHTDGLLTIRVLNNGEVIGMVSATVWDSAVYS